jgi:hypothetical protein
MLFVLCYQLNAQTAPEDTVTKTKEQLEFEKYKKLAEPYWTNTGSDEVPEKWKDESAVILYQYFYNSYKKNNLQKSIENQDIVRERILLKDKAAVRKYSEMSFNPMEIKDDFDYLFGVKIIKASGTETIIDPALAVDEKVDNQVVSKKLALPDLSPGDIIDYFTVDVSKVYFSNSKFIFKPAYYTLVDEFPIKTQKIEFTILRKCYINLISINGAPKIVKSSSNESEENDTYTLVQNEIEKTKDKRWLFDYRQFPCIKFQVAYGKTREDLKGFFFASENAGELKSSVSESEIVDFVTFHTKTTVDLNTEIDKFLKDRYDEKSDDPSKLCALLEEFYRSKYISRLGYSDRQNFAKTFKAFNMYTAYFKSKNYKVDIIVAPRKHLSNLKEIICINDIGFIYKVNINNKDYYMYPPSNFSAPLHKRVETSDVDAYQIAILPTAGKTLSKVKTPALTPDENAETNKLSATINLNDDYKINAYSVTSSYGIRRNYAQLTYPVKMLEHQEYGPSQGDYYTYTIDYDYRLNYSHEITGESSYSYYYTWDDISGEVESDYEDEIENLDFAVTSSGISYLKPYHEVHLYFTLKNYIKKIDTNYVVDAGKLLSSNVKIESDEAKNRQYDIYFDGAPRKFTNEVDLIIPEGYRVKGIDNFNKNFKSEIGEFIVTAKVEGNKLIIRSEKIYYHHMEPKENWLKLKEFLDFAWEITQKRILLEKI